MFIFFCTQNMCLSHLTLVWLQLTFGVCWPRTVPLRRTAAIGTHGVGAVVGRRHRRPPVAEEDPRRHGLRPSRRLDRSSVELVVCQAAILGVSVVLRRATVLRDFWGLFNYYCLLFGAFLLLLGFLLLLLLTQYFAWVMRARIPFIMHCIISPADGYTWWESFAAAAARPVSMEATRAPSLAGRSCRGTEGPTRAERISILEYNTHSIDHTVKSRPSFLYAVVYLWGCTECRRCFSVFSI